ncbi:curli production assembly/transport component CsgG [Hymenobacter oligotrophus]|uniref:Curli production assembly/transport component CsgG n=1 Tax=Hymenobacter oligotrophus TaxID=2319843 RepID=A0A3B7R3J5_9BACT|nr:CsgG/HfaB family protein [Hymenobacter oligotrophus]AYA35929.1 curli production assembly/transport component CsgG [Hymenobacter oligotrophus]
MNTSLLRLAHRLALATALVAGGCAPYFHQPLSTQPARLGAEVNANAELRSLPMPREKAVVAVYKFRDQTGQYKPTASGSSFSTAVTQGTTTILMRALEESRWFDAIERENLSNLLNERKIIRSTRAEYSEQTGQRQPPLPPLLFAGIILEGGIISYDANMLTGGAGLRYFGAGASGQYRQDRVTVYLRAISTANGRVLKTVYTSKTILSQQVDAGLFRFVNFKRLLETETGFTYNEPSEMAVKEAIEKSVRAMVFEGIKDGLWAPRNPEDANGPSMRAYLQEKDENLTVDVLGRDLHPRRSTLGIGLSAGLQRYSGDFANPLIRPQGALTVRYQFGAGRWSAFASAGRGQLSAEKYLNRTLNYTEGGISYRLFPLDAFTPVVFAGGGVTVPQRLAGGASAVPVPHTLFGLGAEYLLTKRIGLHASLENRYFLNDKLDNMPHGSYNDYTWGGRVGFTYYLGSSAKRQATQ